MLVYKCLVVSGDGWPRIFLDKSWAGCTGKTARSLSDRNIRVKLKIEGNVFAEKIFVRRSNK